MDFLSFFPFFCKFFVVFGNVGLLWIPNSHLLLSKHATRWCFGGRFETLKNVFFDGFSLFGLNELQIIAKRC